MWFRGFFPVRFLHLSVNTVFYLCLYGMMLEMTYFHAELVQLIVSQSDSEQEVHGMKINTFESFTLLILTCWKMNCESDNVKNCPQTAEVSFWKPNCGNWVFGFWILRSVRFGLVFRKLMSDIFIQFCAPPSTLTLQPMLQLWGFSFHNLQIIETLNIQIAYHPEFQLSRDCISYYFI